MKRKKIKILLFVLVVLSLPFIAKASLLSIGDVAAGAIAGVMAGVTYIIGYIAGLILAFVAWLTSFALDLNYQVLGPQNTLVQVGWSIVRDIANLGFVIVIIVMAFATILRFESYNYKSILRKLIAAAILVNFSLAIAGIFIDFSHILTKTFFEKTGNPADIGSALGGAFGLQRFLQTDLSNADLSESVAAFGTTVLTQIAALSFVIVFSFVAIIVVAAFGLMLLLRYLWLSFLLVISPIVWLFWVIPALSGQFQKWWSKFFEWVFFAPALSFFIYLALLSTQKLAGMPLVTSQGVNFFSGTILGIVSQGMQMILICGIMIGGLMVAQNMGITGAAGAMKIASKAGKGLQDWAGAKVKRGYDRASATVLDKAGKPMADFMKKIPGLKRAGFALGGQSDIIRDKLVDDAEKRLADYNDVHIAKNLDAFSKPEKIAALRRLAKNGTINELVPDVASHITEENKKLFTDYSQGRAWTKEVEVAAGMDTNMASVIKNLGETLKSGISADKLQAELDEVTQRWITGLTDAQMANLPAKELFNGKGGALGLDDQSTEILRKATLRCIAINAPENIAKMFTKLKGEGQKQLKNFAEDTAKRIARQQDPETGQSYAGQAEKLRDALNQISSLRLFSGQPVAGAASPKTTTPPPAGKNP